MIDALFYRLSAIARKAFGPKQGCCGTARCGFEQHDDASMTHGETCITVKLLCRTVQEQGATIEALQKQVASLLPRSPAVAQLVGLVEGEATTCEVATASGAGQ